MSIDDLRRCIHVLLLPCNYVGTLFSFPGRGRFRSIIVAVPGHRVVIVVNEVVVVIVFLELDTSLNKLQTKNSQTNKFHYIDLGLVH